MQAEIRMCFRFFYGVHQKCAYLIQNFNTKTQYMASVHIHNLLKNYYSDDKRIISPVIDNCSLTIQDGEFVSIFGPNGSGKSTLLSIIAGLEKPDGGSITFDNAANAKPKIGFVFQNYNESMLPWRTVRGNVELALENTAYTAQKRKEIALHLLEKVGLAHASERYFYDLSGGMKQLVAICRAFASEPDVLLLDEPFSALDYATTRRVEMDLLSVWSEQQRTAICISHDVDDAVFLADRVIILSQRPAKIKGIIDITLPRPRTPEMFVTEEFYKFRTKVLEIFSHE